MKLMNLYRKAKRYYRNIINPKENKSVGGHGVKISFTKKIKYNMLGFTDKEIVYYDLLHNDYHDYISQHERLKLENINGRFADILGEKVMLERIWGNYIHVPKTYSIIMNGRFIDLDDKSDEVDIPALLRDKKKLMAKPTRSMGGGNGICSISFEGGKYFIDKTPYEPDKFIDELRKYEQYIIIEWIYPHEYAKRVFPKTTNTMRIVTVMNHDTCKAEVLSAAQRFGTELSVPVDNGCSGGIYGFVDVETGIMEEAHEMLDIHAVHEKHPDTGYQIKGLQIPEWQRIKKQMIHIHNCFPYYEFLAWDVVLAEDGELGLIEINRGMDLHWLQVIRPLRKSNIGEYMRKKGYLRNW